MHGGIVTHSKEMRPATLLLHGKFLVCGVVVADEGTGLVMAEDTLRYSFASCLFNGVQSGSGCGKEPTPAVLAIDAETGLVGVLHRRTSYLFKDSVVLIGESGLNGMEEFLDSLTGDGEFVLGAEYLLDLCKGCTHAVFEEKDK